MLYPQDPPSLATVLTVNPTTLTVSLLQTYGVLEVYDYPALNDYYQPGDTVLVLFTADDPAYGYVAGRAYANAQALRPVATDDIADGAVTTDKLADGAVATAKIAAGAVTAGELAGDAVATHHLVDQAVTGTKLADDAVDTTHIANNAIITTKLDDGAVTGPKLAGGAVTTEKLADDAVSEAKLAPNILLANRYLGIANEGTADLAMTGLFDRNELTHADKMGGSITVTFTGAGSLSAGQSAYLVDAAGSFCTLAGTDLTTTQIRIAIDLGRIVSVYGRALWQPFFLYRTNAAGSFTWYNQLVVEVSLDNVTWYKPAGGAWEIADFAAQQTFPGGWIGPEAGPGVPGFAWRYARFTLTDRRETAAYASKAEVWIAELGIRHLAAPFARQFLPAIGGTLYGDLALADGKNVATGTVTGAKIGTSATEKIGLWGKAPVVRPGGYTQTYATATKTHANVTAVNPAAYAAGANGYSTAAMAQAIHAEVIALRADLVNVKGVLNAVIDDLQAVGFTT